MKVKDLRKKRHLLQLCKELSGDFEGLSFKEAIEKMTTEIDVFDSKVAELENEVIKKYKGLYLKKFSEEGRFFGNEVEVIYIKDMSISSYTDNWERTYLLSGIRLNFSSLGANYREFDTRVDSMFTSTQLKEYVEITEVEFNSYVAIHNQINRKMKKALKK